MASRLRSSRLRKTESPSPPPCTPRSSEESGVRNRKRLTLAIIAFVALALAAAPAFGFKLPPHEQIVRTSLTPAGLPPEVLDTVVGTFASGRGNLGSDRHQAD